MNNKEYIIELATKNKNKNKIIEKHITLFFTTLELKKKYLKNNTQVLVYTGCYPLTILQLISHIKRESDLYVYKLSYNRRILIHRRLPHLMESSHSASSSESDSNKMFDYSSSEDSAGN